MQGKEAEQMPELIADKRGYLLEDFRVFHLKDSRAPRLEDHYHEFDKLILFLGGKVTYVVEGVRYFLQPWDLLLVRRGMIHRADIDPSEPYERIILWLGPDYLQRHSRPDSELSACFDLSRQRNFHLLRFSPERRLVCMQAMDALEGALRSSEFGSALLADTLCQQLLILVNRAMAQDRTAEQTDAYRVDSKMESVLRYIGEHLTEPLDVETLAGQFYLSRYYLMHRFKACTGYTVHQYITQKRLLLAGEQIRSGVPVMKAAEQSGFQEYSTFLRAFQNTFHVSPREFYGQTGKKEAFHALTNFY